MLKPFLTAFAVMLALLMPFLGSSSANALGVGFGAPFGENPFVITGPAKVFATNQQTGIVLRHVELIGMTFVPKVVIGASDPSGTTNSFLAEGPVLFDVIGASGSGGVLPTGGIFGPFAFTFDVNDENPAAAILGVDLSGITVDFLIGIGDSYDALTNSTVVGPGDSAGGSGATVVPLPAAALPLVGALVLLVLVRCRRRAT